MLLSIILLFFYILQTVVVNSEFWGPTPLEYIRKYNYSGERHRVQTEDGYILTIYRIRPKRLSVMKPVPVLLVHGLCGQCENFLYTSDSLAFRLADGGRDVWLMNTRGTIWSRDHIRLDSARDDAFWQFTWHHIGLYDNPAVIDYVLRMTQQRQLVYMGHSQGGTTLFVMCSLRPHYNRKIQMAVLLSPAALTKHTLTVQPYPTVVLGIFDGLKILAEEQNWHQLRVNDDIRLVLARNCALRRNLQLCSWLIQTYTDVEAQFLNSEVVSKVLWSFPSTVAKGQFLHYMQNIERREFAAYDFGKWENLHQYGREQPPLYNLTRIEVPIVLFCSTNDRLVAKQDCLDLNLVLPNITDTYVVPRRTFGHYDYIVATDAVPLVYKKIINILNKI